MTQEYDEWDYQFTPIKGHYLPHKYRVDRRINHYEHGVYDSERIGDLIVLHGHDGPIIREFIFFDEDTDRGVHPLSWILRDWEKFWASHVPKHEEEFANGHDFEIVPRERERRGQ